MATFSDYAKNIFWVLILLQFAPVLIKSIRTQYSDAFEEKTKVGLFTLSGSIQSAYPAVHEIKQLFEDKSLKALVFKINSPGGVAPSAQAIFQEILHYKKLHPEKYVVSFVEQIAASGGYYIASATDYIIATPSSIIGSIGAYFALPNVKDFIEHYKLQYNIVKAGDMKAAGNPFVALTPKDRAQFQSLTDDTYQQFVRDVTKQRPQLPHDTAQWAEGKIFTGEQALGLTLIDEVGSPGTVEKVLREKAHIVGRIEWVKPPKKRSFLSSLFSSQDEDDDSTTLSAFAESLYSVFESRYASSHLIH